MMTKTKVLKAAKSLTVVAACPHCGAAMMAVPAGTHVGSPYHGDLQPLHIREAMAAAGDRIVDFDEAEDTVDQDGMVSAEGEGVYVTRCEDCGVPFAVTVAQCRDLQWRALVMLGEASLEDEVA